MCKIVRLRWWHTAHYYHYCWMVDILIHIYTAPKRKEIIKKNWLLYIILLLTPLANISILRLTETTSKAQREQISCCCRCFFFSLKLCICLNSTTVAARWNGSCCLFSACAVHCYRLCPRFSYGLCVLCVL